MDWLSGGGGIGETHLYYCAISGKSRGISERQNRCPLDGVSQCFSPTQKHTFRCLLHSFSVTLLKRHGGG